jgi:hypothetical protein
MIYGLYALSLSHLVWLFSKIISKRLGLLFFKFEVISICEENDEWCQCEDDGRTVYFNDNEEVVCYRCDKKINVNKNQYI